MTNEAVPPTPECEPYVYCPFTANGAYHGACLWHEGAERTCACNGSDHGDGHPADCEVCTAPRTAYDITALIRVRVQARDRHEAYTIAHQLLSPPPELDDPHYVLTNSINGHPIEGQLRTYYPVEHRRVGDDT